MIEEAFSERQDLKEQIITSLSHYPEQRDLFHNISSYVLQLKRNQAILLTNGSDQRAFKKRRLDEETITVKVAEAPVRSAWADASVSPCWKATDVSFSIPQRKKFTAEIVPSSSQSQGDGGIRAVNPATNTIEFGTAWKDVEQIFCLPVPEKAKKQHNFIVIPKDGNGVTSLPEGVVPPEQIVWTFIEASGKDIKEGEDPGPAATAAELSKHIAPFGKTVIFPSEKVFASTVPEPHRKGDKTYHVKAFRGSKEGYLFFTSVGILFGFKKPLAFFPFDIISSVSYTSVLQRTFNLVIAVSGDDGVIQEIEFSMLDQADYGGIDDYIQSHSLHDASMAEARKAKRLNVNGLPASKAENINGTPDAGGGEPMEEESELAKAQREMDEDEEDELEEDYHPGSEGESEGSGSDSDSSSEEDEDEEDDEEEEEEEGSAAGP